MLTPECGVCLPLGVGCAYPWVWGVCSPGGMLLSSGNLDWPCKGCYNRAGLVGGCTYTLHHHTHTLHHHTHTLHCCAPEIKAYLLVTLVQMFIKMWKSNQIPFSHISECSNASTENFNLDMDFKAFIVSSSIYLCYIDRIYQRRGN